MNADGDIVVAAQTFEEFEHNETIKKKALQGLVVINQVKLIAVHN